MCVRFVRSALLKAVERRPDLRAEEVTYLTLAQLRRLRVRVQDLPFLKRFAFEHENEFRMTYESTTRRLPKLDIRVPLSTIETVTLSPWIHPDLVEPVKESLWSIEGCSNLKILRSTLIGNADWKSLGDSVMKKRSADHE